MANIFARSPYIVEINENDQVETRVELRIWNGTGSAPTNPTYILSKLIPSTSNRLTTYNISPYIKEFLSHPLFTNNHSAIAFLPSEEYCNVQIKRYKRVGSTWSQVGQTENHYGLDGYGLYTEGYNKNLGDFLLNPKTYYYHYVAGANLTNEPLKRAGNFTALVANDRVVLYQELGTGNSTTIGFTSVTARWHIIPRVFSNYMAKGCRTLICDPTLESCVLIGTFKPKTECKYTPICCDFINRYGAWQREYFFKASKNNINVENSEYNLYQAFVNYDTKEGQRKTFNTNYTETITVNTDWVSEDFSDNLRELMTSERILLDNRPVKLNTKSIELQKHINTKMINYSLEFQYAFDIINNVI
jgi:hypothetical protein